MTDHAYDLAILGCGTMGEAIAAGLLDGGVVSKDRLCLSVRRDARREELASRYGVAVTLDNVAAARDARVVLVALKPQRLRAVLDDDAMRAATAGGIVVSIAAGVALARLEHWLPGAHVVRAMPNTPCLIREGMTVLAPGAGVSPEELTWLSKVFGSVGDVVVLEDKLMDVVTSLNGSGPAFCYVMLEALADGGVMMGLPRDVALRIAARVFSGSAKMVLETGFHPAALKDQVTTPAGSTIAGLLTMEDGRIRSVLARTIEAATKVAARLGEDGGSEAPG